MVFTLGIDESWRETKRVPPLILCKPGICINGVIYRFVFHRGLAIVAFDIKTENSKLIALRDISHGWSYELIEVKGKLVVVEYEICSCEKIHLFVFEQTRKGEEWKSSAIQFPSTWKYIQQEIILDVRLSCTSCDGKILFTTKLKSGTLCLCYDVTRQSCRKLETNGS